LATKMLASTVQFSRCGRRHRLITACPAWRAQHDRSDRSAGRCVGLRAFEVRIRLRVRSAPSGPNSVPTQ
jgi:hypothetical protein